MEGKVNLVLWRLQVANEKLEILHRLLWSYEESKFTFLLNPTNVKKPTWRRSWMLWYSKRMRCWNHQQEQVNTM